MNERRMRGPDASAWVLFELQSTDGRLPSLDDGLSWPVLFDNSGFVSSDCQFVLLRKAHFLHATTTYDDFDARTCKTGATVSLPNTNEPLFAKIELKPTLAGRLLIALFKPPELHIVLGLKDGGTQRYRGISNIMVTGFMMSPLICNTADFASLVAERSLSQDSSIVRPCRLRHPKAVPFLGQTRTS